MAKTAKAKAAKTAKTVKAKVVTGGSRQANLARAIKVTVKENPRRPGTAAHKYHEAMAKSATVGDYMRRFKDDKARRDAGLWLNASARDGHVKLGKPAAAAA